MTDQAPVASSPAPTAPVQTPAFTIGQQIVILSGLHRGRRLTITKIDNTGIFGKVKKGGLNAVVIGPLQLNEIKVV